MSELETRIADFLNQEHIAVVGVRSTQDDAANLIYRKFREAGYTVYAINPNAETVEGDPCYANLWAAPTKPDAVVIVTRPEITENVVQQCAELGITRVWIHQSFMGNSLSPTALETCKTHNIEVIPGLCPMMYVGKVDFFHGFACWLPRVTGKMPAV